MVCSALFDKLIYTPQATLGKLIHCSHFMEIELQNQFAELQ